jgi:hypothetical protein
MKGQMLSLGALMAACIGLHFRNRTMLGHYFEFTTHAALTTTDRRASADEQELEWEGALVDNNNASSLFPWKDMDLHQRGTCGAKKCFFRSVSNHTIGYLVTGEDLYGGMLRAVQMAEDLQNEFGTSHLYMDVTEVNATAAILDVLNAAASRPLELVGKEGERRAPVLHFETANATVGRLTVQRVRAAPEPSLFLGSASANLEITLNRVAAFRQLIPDRQAFRRQIEVELERFSRLLPAYPQLRYDLQGLVDLEGRFYLIDLDGFDHSRKVQNAHFAARVIHKRLATLRNIVDMLTAPDAA